MTDRSVQETSAKTRVFGWKYWGGAAIVVTALLVLAAVINWVNGASSLTDADLVVGFISWPFLLVYHVLFKRRRRT